MPDIIKWDETCRVGVEEMDAAHRTLFGIGNRMIRAVVENKGESESRDVIDEMIEYAEKHFTREEELLLAARFPRLEQHHAIHQRLMNDIRLFKSQYIAGDVDGSAVATFLIEWIVDHIKKIDKAYSPYLRPPAEPQREDRI